MSDENQSPLSLEEALKSGAVFTKDQLDKILQDELKKHEKSLKNKMLKEARNEIAAEAKVSEENQLSKFMDGTGLTDKAFARKLRQLQIPIRYWKCLRDEHIKMTPKQLWAYIRSQDNPLVRQSNQW